jgi:lipoate---protein ligase
VCSDPCGRPLISARFVDIGTLEPLLFHATYTGIAEAQQRAAAPVVVWGRSTPHISLGQSQDRSRELAADLDVPVVTRALGGGAVWIDEAQHCLILIAPLARAPARPADWFEWGLAPVIATYHRFGLQAVRREQDVWVAGRKIAGSGAATIGQSAVFASSFMLRFPARKFARCISSSSPGFCDWLVAGLQQAVTDWESQRQPPAADELQRTFRSEVERAFGWRLGDSAPSAAEVAARDTALEELAAPPRSGRRQVAGGIKLNAATFLTERNSGSRLERSLSVDGVVIRRCSAAV